MVTFYKHHIPDWMEGTESLDDAEYRVYHVIVQLIYLNEGPILNHERGIAGRCRMHVLTYRKALRALLELKKLGLTEDGRIANLRATSELLSVNRNRTNAALGGVRSRSVSKSPRKPLENNGQATASLFDMSSLKDKTRLEKTDSPSPNGEGAAGELDLTTQADRARSTSAPQPGDQEQELFRRGREVLGKNAGGMIAQLLKAKGKPELARAAIEQAAVKHNPREYIGAIIRGPQADDIWRPARGAIV
jgi:uncharacterized protein YdaU (DUF1376 family)